MNSKLIPEIHHHFLNHLGLEHNYREIIQEFDSFHNLENVGPSEFINFLSETGQAISLSYIIQRIKEDEFNKYIQTINFPLLLIDCEGESKAPVFVSYDEKQMIGGGFELEMKRKYAFHLKRYRCILIIGMLQRVIRERQAF